MTEHLSYLIPGRRSLVSRGRLFALITILLLALPPDARMQARRDAREILKRVGEVYKDAGSYHAEGTLFIIFDSPENYAKLDMPIITDGTRPNKSRQEIRHPVFGYLSITDGQTTWSYLQSKNIYTKKASTGATASLTAEYKDKVKEKKLDLAIGTASDNMLSNYENLEQKVRTARLLREEALVVGGQKTDCYVIELEWKAAPETFGVKISPRTLLWIDKTKNLVIRDAMTLQVEMNGRAVAITYDYQYRLIKLNAPVADSLFIFIPPDGAREVENLERP